MTATYFARTALDEIDRAQAELERHLAVRPSGLCATCGEVEPCAARRAAATTFTRYGLLPRRRYGVAGVRSSGSNPAGTEPRSWFAASAAVDPTISTTPEQSMTQQQGHPAILGPKELRERLGKISAGQLFSITSRDDFPLPVATLQQGRVWLEEDVDKWIAENGPGHAVP